MAVFRALQRWEHPLASLGAIAVCLLGAVLPSLVCAVVPLLLAAACGAGYPHHSRPLLEMEVGPCRGAPGDEEVRPLRRPLPM